MSRPCFAWFRMALPMALLMMALGTPALAAEPTQAQKDAFVAALSAAIKAKDPAKVEALRNPAGLDAASLAFNKASTPMFLDMVGANVNALVYTWLPPKPGGAKALEIVNQHGRFTANAEPVAILQITDPAAPGDSTSVPVCLVKDKLMLLGTIKAAP